LVQKIYEFFKLSLEKEYRYCVTDVAVENQRSLKAHIKSGFEIISTNIYGGVEWNVILWDWEKSGENPPLSFDQ
jgi:L-amino acid N-acyltransferase YncA